MTTHIRVEKVLVWPANDLPKVEFIGKLHGKTVNVIFERVNQESRPEIKLIELDEQISDGIQLSGISRVYLKPKRIRIDYHETIGNGMQLDPQLICEFGVTSAELVKMRKALRKLFRGTKLFTDDAATGFALLRAIIIGPPTPGSEMLVAPFFCTVAGSICFGILGWKYGIIGVIGGILAGAAVGAAVGFLKRYKYYGHHKYPPYTDESSS